jgi:hypothetical protein
MRRIQFAGSFILVEGRTDQKLYGKFIIRERCQIVVCLSKCQVLAALEILRASDFAGVIGIVDADFARAAAEELGHDDIFLTDGHDAEIMLLATTAVDAVLDEHSSHEKRRAWELKYGENVITRLMREAIKTGCLLWFSCVNNMSLNFGELKTQKYMDRGTLEIDVLRLVNHVKQRSCRQDIKDKQLLDGIKEMRNRCSDPFLVARGHDVVEYLAFALQSTVGTCTQAQANREGIEALLRAAYKPEDFFKTKLYSSVIEWERKQSPYEVFVK